MKKLIFLFLLATTFGCENQENTPPKTLSDFLFHGSNSTLSYTVDSIILDPTVNGTSRDSSTRVWRLTVEFSEDDRSVFNTTVHDTAGQQIASFLWDWELSEGRLLNQIAGTQHLGLVSPISETSVWDDLVFTDQQQVYFIRQEPVRVFSPWELSTVDSFGIYILPNGTPIEAVWITHANTETLLELRVMKEVYGVNEGLLEREMRIFNSQIFEDLPWDEKAETGFSVIMKRN